MEGKIRVAVKHGLHARAAAEFVKLAAGFSDCSIKIIGNKKQADAKSILGVMSASVAEGDDVTLTIDGPSEKKAFEILSAYLTQTEKKEIRLRGTAIFRGTAMGKIKIHKGFDMSFSEKRAGENEVAIFDEALERCKNQLQELQTEAKARFGSEKADIFAAHAEIARDEAFSGTVREKIAGGKCASDAVILTVREWSEKFSALDNALLRERAADIEDVGKRLFSILNGLFESEISGSTPCILAANSLSPSEIAKVDKNSIRGIITRDGGGHFAILVGALGIPAISGIDIRKLEKFDGLTAIIDGDVLIISPCKEITEAFEQKIKAFAAENENLKLLRSLPAETSDGRKISLWGNISSANEASGVLENGGDGIGLFRTEFLFMDRELPPSEDEQFAEYSKAVNIMQGKPVVIRTLDCGGDKPMSYLKTNEREKNPFLGVRGVRLCLRERELFLAQLRAMLRASALGDLRILVPMVTNINDIFETKKILTSAQQQLENEKISFNPRVKFGIMIEVPSAAIEAERLAREVDFFSVGSNDLTQYTLAADRTNPGVAEWADGLHPAVLRLMKASAEAAARAKISCGICGELAGDAASLPLLAALGFDSLSMAPAKIPHIKKALREVSIDFARKALSEKLQPLA